MKRATNPDHVGLNYLSNTQNSSGVRVSWLDVVEECDLKIRYHSGKACVIVETLNWNPVSEEIPSVWLCLTIDTLLFEKIGNARSWQFMTRVPDARKSRTRFLRVSELVLVGERYWRDRVLPWEEHARVDGRDRKVRGLSHIHSRTRKEGWLPTYVHRLPWVE